AKASPDAPALDMPPPPPRSVEPMEAEPPATPPTEEPVRHAPTPSGSSGRRTTPTSAPRPDAAKPEPPKPEPAAEPAKAPDETSKPPTTLQITPAGSEGGVERSIRTILRRATGDLSRVDYQKLNADARTQYDTAKRFVTQAEDALRAKNLVLAKSVADKAAGLAAQLASR